MCAMAKVRKVVGTLLEIWGGIRLVVDILSSLDATKEYAHYAYIELVATPASTSLTVAVIVVGLVLLGYEPLTRFFGWKQKPSEPPRPADTGWLSLRTPSEVHRHDLRDISYFFLRNCSSLTAIRNVRFDPIESRNG